MVRLVLGREDTGVLEAMIGRKRRSAGPSSNDKI